MLGANRAKNTDPQVIHLLILVRGHCADWVLIRLWNRQVKPRRKVRRR